jgi:hypothetical protein
MTPIRSRGLGQSPPAQTPMCSDLSLQQYGSLGTLFLGLAATGVGVVGLFASEKYQRAFGVTAAIGAVGTVIGSLWAARYYVTYGLMPECINSAGQLESSWDTQQTEQAQASPAPSPALPVSTGT